ncbi:MAG: lysophospholipid acyltransferase family protein [Ignavibacteriaceae bacterium]
MLFKKLKKTLLKYAGNFFLTVTVNLLCKTLRVEKRNSEIIEKMYSENKNFILAFWHGTMILPWFLHSAKNFVGLTSKSKDGDLLAKMLHFWKYKVVRGSSSSGGDVALGIIVDFAKSNYSVAITPDGPRGPRHKMKAGSVIAAKRSSVPLVLAGVGFKKKKILANWDKFEIPFPFTKARIIYSEPLNIDKDLSYDKTSEMIMQCENELNRLQREAGRFD